MSQILEICHCGNDRASHFEGKHTCLAMACDCTEFRNRDVPLPPKPKTVRVAAPDPDDTIDDTYSPNTHRTGCVCAICKAPHMPFYPFPYGAP